MTSTVQIPLLSLEKQYDEKNRDATATYVSITIKIY
jgi:hypothetical protein